MKRKIILLSVMVALVLATIIILSIVDSKKYEYVSYKDFNIFLENEEVDRVTLEDSKVKFTKKNDQKLFYTDNPNNENFSEKLLLKGVNLEKNSTKDTIAFIFDILFYLFFFSVVIFAGTKFLGFTGGNFKVVKHTKIKFDDIAGMDDLKQEMKQIVDVLKNPEEYKNRGIRQTKGIIFEGNPGNGKTLFAKALAEELNVNFIATRGADFQSAMMSMGAQKIKALFRKAKRYKPCIIFIDEFDSIGEKRNYAGTGVDKENNRIVTTMLNEMDGFETQDGILVIAATNSYSSLDQALIRPGRFDLKYTISNPDNNTRIKLIELYTKQKKLSDEIDKQQLADCFENLTCSAIETVLNVASMEASLEKHDEISLDNIVVAARKTNCSINLKRIRNRK